MVHRIIPDFRHSTMYCNLKLSSTSASTMFQAHLQIQSIKFNLQFLSGPKTLANVPKFSTRKGNIPQIKVIHPRNTLNSPNSSIINDAAKTVSDKPICQSTKCYLKQTYCCCYGGKFMKSVHPCLGKQFSDGCNIGFFNQTGLTFVGFILNAKN
jgi:hypothetical protein